MNISLWFSTLKQQYRRSYRKRARQRQSRSLSQNSGSVTALHARRMTETLEDRTLLTAFTVTNADDAGAGSLRDAIEAANANAGADTISFDAALAGQTIVLTTELQITDDLTLTGLGADQLTLDGDGNSRIFNIDDGSSDTMLNVEISGLSLVNGFSENGGGINNYEKLIVTDMIFSANDVSNPQIVSAELNNGGGIRNAGGELTVMNSTFRNNSANDGGAIYNTDGDVDVINCEISENKSTTIQGQGGGIYSINGAVTVSDSSLSGNLAENATGGGIQIHSGDLEVTNCDFTENFAYNRGGGIDFVGTSLVVKKSSFLRNSASINNAQTGGGGIHVSVADTPVILQNCLFEGNTALSGGAGIKTSTATIVVGCTFSDNSGSAISNSRTLTLDKCYIHHNSGTGVFNLGTTTIMNSTISENSAPYQGGAISNRFGTVRIYNSTLSDNFVSTNDDSIAYGGAIYNYGTADRGLVFVINSTITGNLSSNYGGGIYSQYNTVTLTNSIVAGNTSPEDSQINGDFTSTNSIIQDSIAGLLDPVLRDNGGPTRTHALLLGSAAIDAGDNSAVINTGLTTDQRGIGYQRIAGDAVDIGAYEAQLDHTQIDLSIVDSKTATGSNDEVSMLPQSMGRVDEWGGYWLEIWVRTPAFSDQGVLSAAFDLKYNTNISTATSIEYGAAFSVNQTGTINDQQGLVENLSAETSLGNVTANQHLLLARIRFEVTADDAVDLNRADQSLNQQNLAFSLEHPEVLFVDGTACEDLLILEPQTQILANPFDLNDDGIINFRDLIRFASVYQQTPSQSASNDAWFADYNQDDHVDFHDLILFATNYGKRKAGPEQVTYPGNFPDDWNQLLMVTATEPPQKPASTVTQAAAETLLKATVEEISPQLTAAQQATLSTVDVQVVDLAEGTLGRAAAGTIYLDVNASGYGWFVDATPEENSEFVSNDDLTLIALPDSEAAGVIDLRTVILHELAHLLGYDHTEDGLMQETLAPGVRYLSDWEAAADEFFSGVPIESELNTF